MPSTKDIAAGFTISGLLDESSKTRSRYPIMEVPLDSIADHPNNTVYSMDAQGIADLAASILESGLTDLPLVRKLSSGDFQMISGHRRKAAYALLSQEHPEFAKMPVCVIEDISDAEAVTLLHSANYFTRSLSVTERAAATRALGVEVECLRIEDKSVAGMRTEDIKAAIITRQTGRQVSGRTIKRQEALADLIETRIIEPWRHLADNGLMSAASIESLAEVAEEDQIALYDGLPEFGRTKVSIAHYICESLAGERRKAAAEAARRELEADIHATIHPFADARLGKSIELLRAYLAAPPMGPRDDDLEACALIARLSAFLPGQAKSIQGIGRLGLRR